MPSSSPAETVVTTIALFVIVGIFGGLASLVKSGFKALKKRKDNDKQGS